MKETGKSNGLANTLLDWFEQEGRDLPWRNTTDPYHILVSEIMLQQTQVHRVLVFFDAWLKQFPNWQTLAAATNAEIILAWQGLGYNRRGLALRDIARQVVENGVPQSEEEWLKLKGIGPYTAAALTVFSLRYAAAPIDTNIRRVIARLQFGIHYPDGKIDAQLIAYMKNELMTHERFYDIPQAIFDLATAYCTKTPQCEICPMKDYCASQKEFTSGSVQTPKRMVKKSHEKKHAGKPHPDRIYRGRILKLVSEKEGIARREIGPCVDKTYSAQTDELWMQKMIDRLVNDGFLVDVEARLFLKR